MTCCTSKDIPPLSEVRHQVVIQEVTFVADGSGGQAETWTPLATVWASIKPKIVKEVVFGQKLESRVQFDIFFRYLAGVTTDDRIIFGARTFQIKAAINIDELGEWIHVLAEEFVGT